MLRPATVNPCPSSDSLPRSDTTRDSKTETYLDVPSAIRSLQVARCVNDHRRGSYAPSSARLLELISVHAEIHDVRAAARVTVAIAGPTPPEFVEVVEFAPTAEIRTETVDDSDTLLQHDAPSFDTAFPESTPGAASRESARPATSALSQGPAGGDGNRTRSPHADVLCACADSCNRRRAGPNPYHSIALPILYASASGNCEATVEVSSVELASRKKECSSFILR